MTDMKIGFCLLLAIYCALQPLSVSGCSCQPCNHLGNQYERCSCCRYHMVGGKRSFGLGTDNSNSNTLSAQLQNGLQRNNMPTSAETLNSITSSPEVQNFESDVSKVDNEYLLRLMLSFLTDSKVWLPKMGDFKDQSPLLNNQKLVLPAQQRLSRSPFSSSGLSEGNDEKRLGLAALIRRKALEGLLDPQISDADMQNTDNSDFMPLAISKGSFADVSRSLRSAGEIEKHQSPL